MTVDQHGGADGIYAGALVDALIAMSTDLDLHSTLQRIVDAATRLGEASYGALGVLDGDGKLVDFVTSGIDDATREAIGALPLGHGLLSLLHPASGPIRLDDLTAHPGFVGFPEHHPRMTSFLGVEVRGHGQVFGNLYLTDKRGGEPFTHDDERLLQAFATGAAFVMDNARAYHLSEARGRWLEASAAITRSLVGPDLDSAFQQVVDLAREVSGATTAFVALLRSEDLLEVRVVSGASSWHPGGAPVPIAGSIAGEALSSPEPLLITEVGKHPAVPALLESIGRPPTGPAAMLPLRTTEGTAGLLVLAWDRAASLPFRAFDLGLASSFAEQAALALEVSRARSAVERRSLSEDRDRIARDLHDVVIQRLFAIGLQLDSVAETVRDAEAAALVSRVVDEIDLSIRDIRTSIFKLQNTDLGSLRAAIHDLVDEYAVVLGFAPGVAVRGPVEQAASCRDDVLAVLREALSNVARHAQASWVDVVVAVTDTHVTLEVCDDGRGLPPQRAESGLRNARTRAAARDGRLTLDDREPSGTQLVWRVPL